MRLVATISNPRAFPAILCIIGCLLSTACRKGDQDFFPQFDTKPPMANDLPRYRFGVQPMRATRQLFERYSKLVDELNGSVAGFRLTLVSAQTEQTYEQRLRDRELDAAIVEPHRVLEAEPLGYKAIARVGNADRIAGVIVIRRGSDIHRIKNLKGKTIAFPSPTGLASAMLVRMYLRDGGLNMDRSATSVYPGSPESSLIAVATERADAAGVSRDAWNRFVESNELAERLEARWTTEELPGAAVMVKGSFPKEHAAALQRALLALKNSEQGRAALHRAGFSEFHYGEEASYDELWEFLTNYARAFPSHDRPSSVQ